MKTCEIVPSVSIANMVNQRAAVMGRMQRVIDLAGPLQRWVRPLVPKRKETMHNIFAHTEATPEGGFPAYVSINRDDHGRHTITVRSRGDGGRNVATIEVSESVLARIAVALMDPRKRLGNGGASG